MKYLLIALILFGNSCVKKRPVEEYKDFDGNRWDKSIFLTEDAWLYRVTLVKSSLNSDLGFVGMQSDAKLGFFEFTQDELRFIAPKTDFPTASNPENLINSWSITHSEIYREEVNGRLSNVETENNEIPWYDKSQFKVSWDSARIKERGSFPFELSDNCWQPINRKVVDGSQEATPEHISFTLAVDYLIQESCIGYREYYTQGFTISLHYKYSFMPDPGISDYKPYVYTGENDPLMDRYGYFNTTFLGYDSNNQEQNKFFMNRWNPNETHTIYFTKEFPDQYKWIYNDPEKGIIPQTNKLFESQGLTIRFNIEDAGPDVNFGDIRYSFVHFVEEPDDSAPLGYGPSTAHPYTGEIISANSILWTSSMQWYIKRIKEYQSREENRALNSPIYSNMSGILGLDSSQWTATSGYLESSLNGLAYRYSIPEFTYELPGTGFATQEAEFKFDSLNRALNLGGMDRFDPNLALNLEKSTDFLKNQDSLTANREYFNNPLVSTRYKFEEHQFASLLQSPITNEQDAIDQILYRVAIHEFGHNLNLRHNFYGSVGAGIHRHSNPESTRNSNSVMDYLQLKDDLDQPFDWEPYDKAALLYAYSDGKVDPESTRKDPYLFCTDHHTIFNPLCNRFDSGSTPSEIILSMIESYDDNYWLRNFRYGRAYWNTGGYGSRIFSTMYNLKKMVRFYDQAFDANTLDQVLSNYGMGVGERSVLSDSMRADTLQAVRMVVAFYLSVVQQSSSLRPFTDSYDSSTGALAQIGIYEDKIFAAMFLMGEDAFPLDPNRGTTVFSLASLAENDTNLAPIVNESLSQAFVDGGDMYAGYDRIIRRLFLLTASGRFELTGDSEELDRAAVKCYRLSTFNSTFNPSAPLEDGMNQIALNQSVPEYDSESVLLALKVADVIYTAGPNKNDLAAEVLKNNDKAGIRDLHSVYEMLVYNRLTPSCE